SSDRSYVLRSVCFHCVLSLYRLLSFVLFLLRPLPPRSTLFPYTTLFRSRRERMRAAGPLAAPVEQAEVVGARAAPGDLEGGGERDRKSTRLNSSHGSISYAVFCLKKKKKKNARLKRLIPTNKTSLNKCND